MKNIEELAITFIKYCKYEKNLSHKTLQSYTVDLKQFIAYLTVNSHPLGISQIDKNIIRAYLQSISDLKPKSIKRKMATVKVLFNFLECEDQIIVNPFRKIKIQIREPFKLPNVMDIKEIEKIIRSAYNIKPSANSKFANSSKVRDIAVIELLFATGLRVSEICDLKVGSVNLGSGLIKVKGKGNKERIITVCNRETLRVLKECYHLFHREEQNNSNYFFLNRLHKRLSDQSIRFLVKKYARIAGLERNITPHVFRHTFATLLLEQDVDIKYIQHLLGHSSIMTTQIYTHVNGERQREILTRKHPRKRFVIAKKSLVV